MKVPVVIHQADGGGYWAEVPALPGCFTQGEMLLEVHERIKEALTCHLLRNKKETQGVAHLNAGRMASPMRQVKIRDLKPLQAPAHSAIRPGLQKLTDAQLLESVQKPKNGDYVTVNSRTGNLHNSNGRAHELLRRAADPNSSISPDMTVPVEDYTPDLSMFPDLD